MKVLAVDDEPQFLRTLHASLAARGHQVLTAGNGEQALELLGADPVDVVVLDLGLPGVDGVEVIRKLRAWSAVPVIVLSVREAQATKVEALDAGADDYMTKPFDIDELMARTRAVVRRKGSGPNEGPVVEAGPLRIDLTKQLVTKRGKPVHLTPTELHLLEQFVVNPGKLLTHRWLLEKVWGGSHVEASHYVRIYVGGLRKKLEDDPADPALILTEPGLGYRWMG